MIDPTQEKLIPLTRVPASVSWLPARRGASRIHVSTIYRWAIKGLDGTCLETLKVGSALCTSEEALKRFFTRLTEADSRCAAGRTPTQRRRAVERASKTLEAAGI